MSVNMKPWLWIPPQIAHDISPWALKLISWVYEDEPIPAWKTLQWRGLVFKNPVGLAGGVDKNAENIFDWWKMGCGFVEVGTVTPAPQEANPLPIIARNFEKKALWNKMGFPSHGAQEVYYNLKRYGPPFRTPIFINLGKNRTTSNADAVKDYIQGIEQFESLAQVFVLNISSPNTVNLRELQKPEALKRLVGPVKEHLQSRNGQPLLVKLSPDRNEEELRASVLTCVELGVDGFILTNTTTSRKMTPDFPAEGGVSGQPLKELSRHALGVVLNSLGQHRRGKLIVSVGGILTPQDAFERLNDGADLVQIYSALIFSGPQFFRETYKEWLRRQQ